MPYPNEHAARIQDPSKFKEFRRMTPKGAPKGLHLILGIRDDGSSELQAIRGTASEISLDDMKEWLERHHYKATKFEEATKKGSFEPFARWIPLDIGEKDTIQKGEDEDGSFVKIGGICSTDDLDFEGESIAQDGLDWSYFLQHGWFNHEHRQGPEAVLGHPEKINPVDENKTHVEGVLYTAKPLGREIYETALALKKAGGKRSLGFSVEGQVTLRDPKNPKRVLKARVLNVAITAMPVNPHTNLELIARSMGATVGYQTPAIPDADANLSALIQQSIDKRVSSEQLDLNDSSIVPKRRITRAELTKILRERISGISERELSELVQKLMRSAKKLRN